jgi:hypothetical protein
MKKIYLFCSLCFFMSCCSTKEGIDKELLDSIYEIHIKNSVSDSFGGLDEYKIKDKKEIVLICKELLALKKKNNLQTRPFKGAIIIEFYKNDNDGSYEASNLLSTGIIFKPNNEYFITYSKGQYTSDPFLAKIIKYLQIDESKVSALDSYRKNKK